MRDVTIYERHLGRSASSRVLRINLAGERVVDITMKKAGTPLLRVRSYHAKTAPRVIGGRYRRRGRKAVTPALWSVDLSYKQPWPRWVASFGAGTLVVGGVDLQHSNTTHFVGIDTMTGKQRFDVPIKNFRVSNARMVFNGKYFVATASSEILAFDPLTGTRVFAHRR